MGQPNYESNIEWKNYGPFYNSLNDRLDECGEYAERVYGNIIFIRPYFARLNNLYNRYNGYIDTNKKIIHQKIINTREILLSSKFNEEYKRYVKGFKVNKEFFNKVNLCIKNMEYIWNNLNLNLVQSTLLPKIKRQRIEKPEEIFEGVIG